MLFSDFLSRDELSKVTYYTYFPVIEQNKNGVDTCRILPSDDAVSYILEFETDSKKIIHGELNWFNKPLYENMDRSRQLASDKITYSFIPKKHDQCIIINLIDFCYGHSFVKLLNIYDFYRTYEKTHDIVVLSFPYIKDFLPVNSLNVVHIEMGFSTTQKALGFTGIVNTIRERYNTVDFAVLDAYKKFENRKSIIDFYNFFGNGINPYAAKKIITFNYRKGIDRSWGGEKQAKRVQTLFEILRKYFDPGVIFCVIGEKDKFKFPDWILDKRIERFPNPILHEYHHILTNSVLTIGMMGSHMLSASILSYMTIHLTPESFLRVAATDITNYNTYSSRAFFNHVYIEGNSLLTDLKPKRLAYKLGLLFLGKISLEYKEYCLQKLKDTRGVELQKEYITKEHGYFNYDMFMIWKAMRDKRHQRTLRMHHIMSKLNIFK